MGESVDPNERARPTGGAEQDSRAGGLSAWTGPTGARRPPGRPHASPVEWPATSAHVNDFLPGLFQGSVERKNTILAKDSCRLPHAIRHARAARRQRVGRGSLVGTPAAGTISFENLRL